MTQWTQWLGNMDDRIARAFGPRQGQIYYTFWPVIYPTPMLYYVLSDASFQLNEVKIKRIELNIDWFDLADILCQEQPDAVVLP